MKKKLIVLVTAAAVAFSFSFTFAKNTVKSAKGKVTVERVWDDG